MGSTTELRISAPAKVHEVLIVILSEQGAHAFANDDDQLVAWFRKPEFEVLTIVRTIVDTFEIRHFETLSIVDQNWNEKWEESLQPVDVGSFHIRPSFASGEIPESKHCIIVDPKMSFGTGYHETTRLVLTFLDDRVTAGDTVLDIGTGTGILAIAAAKKGAGRVIACDIDPWSIDNATENLQLNASTDNIELVAGGISEIRDIEADLIIANINKSALLALLGEFQSRIRNDGRLILSGFLTKDKIDMTRALEEIGLEVHTCRNEGEWLAIEAGHVA